MRLIVNRLPKLPGEVLSFATRFGQECEYVLDDLAAADPAKPLTDKQFAKVAKDAMTELLESYAKPPEWSLVRDAMAMLESVWDRAELCKVWWKDNAKWCRDYLADVQKKKEKEKDDAAGVKSP